MQTEYFLWNRPDVEEYYVFRVDTADDGKHIRSERVVFSTSYKAAEAAYRLLAGSEERG